MWIALLALALTAAGATAQDPPAGTQAQDQTAPSNVVAPEAEDPLADLVNPGDAAILSDEQRITRWAHAQETTTIRSEPRARALGRAAALLHRGQGASRSRQADPPDDVL